MDKRIWGYVRVSTKSQNYEYQERILLETKLKFNHIYHEKQSGKNFERVQYQAMIGAISEGDLIVFPSLDRMGRNYNDIIEQWNLITKTMKCNIKVVDMDLLDTSVRGSTLTGQFISDIVLQILSYVAETERLKIQSRVISGLKNAKENGVILGRPKVILKDNYEEVFNQYNKKVINSRDAMEKLEMKRSTFFSLIKEYNTYLGNQSAKEELSE